jgi:hypothetical protein
VSEAGFEGFAGRPACLVPALSPRGAGRRFVLFGLRGNLVFTVLRSLWKGAASSRHEPFNPVCRVHPLARGGGGLAGGLFCSPCGVTWFLRYSEACGRALLRAPRASTRSAGCTPRAGGRGSGRRFFLFGLRGNLVFTVLRRQWKSGLFPAHDRSRLSKSETAAQNWGRMGLRNMSQKHVLETWPENADGDCPPGRRIPTVYSVLERWIQRQEESARGTVRRYRGPWPRSGWDPLFFKSTTCWRARSVLIHTKRRRTP